MTHELIRREARELGYDVDNLPAVDRPGDPELGDEDVVNVWEQLPPADSIPVQEGAAYGGQPAVGERVTEAEVVRLTDEVDRQIAAGELPEAEPSVTEREASDQ
jgi:hypothetical protein